MQTITSFIAERCQQQPGSKYPLSEFAEDFIFGYLPPEQRDDWSKPKIVAALESLGIPRGRSTTGQVCLANLAPLPRYTYVVRDGRLRKERI
jgi:hypothetical protein